MRTGTCCASRICEYSWYIEYYCRSAVAVIVLASAFEEKYPTTLNEHILRHVSSKRHVLISTPFFFSFAGFVGFVPHTYAVPTTLIFVSGSICKNICAEHDGSQAVTSSRVVPSARLYPYHPFYTALTQHSTPHTLLVVVSNNFSHFFFRGLVACA